MIDKKQLRTKNTSIYPDISLYDIDIDLEINNGKGAWVIILQRNDRFPQPLLNTEATK